jgi:hypothetical protein
VLDSIMGPRPVEAILAGRARVTLAGQEYVLPDLPNRANREWLASLDELVSSSLTGLDNAGDDIPAILVTLKGASEALLDALVAYDKSGVLPSRDVLDDTATPSEILYAVMGVWQAANPLVGIALAGVLPTSTTSSEPTSSSPTTTATRGRRSRKN